MKFIHLFFLSFIFKITLSCDFEKNLIDRAKLGDLDAIEFLEQNPQIKIGKKHLKYIPNLPSKKINYDEVNDNIEYSNKILFTLIHTNNKHSNLNMFLTVQFGSTIIITLDKQTIKFNVLPKFPFYKTINLENYIGKKCNVTIEMEPDRTIETDVTLLGTGEFTVSSNLQYNFFNGYYDKKTLTPFKLMNRDK